MGSCILGGSCNVFNVPHGRAPSARGTSQVGSCILSGSCSLFTVPQGRAPSACGISQVGSCILGGACSFCSIPRGPGPKCTRYQSGGTRILGGSRSLRAMAKTSVDGAPYVGYHIFIRGPGGPLCTWCPTWYPALQLGPHRTIWCTAPGLGAQQYIMTHI